jgi:hypothetical protein
MNRIAPLVVSALLLAGSPALRAGDAEPPLEAALAKGIALVEEGDYGAAIIALDGVVSRLTRLKEQKERVARAHLYLGIAYVGEGQESLAAESFREALRHDPSLTLTPEQFSPKVRERFQRVKNEMAAGRTAQEASRTGAPGAKKGGSKAIFIAGGAAVAGGIALAAGGGGGDGGPNPSPTPAPTFSSDIAVVSVEPPHRSTVSVAAGGTVIRVVAAVTHTTAGSYRLFAADLHQGGTNRECVCGVSDLLSLTPGQRVTTSVPLQFPCNGGLPSCPAFPFDSTGMAIFLYRDDASQQIVIPEIAVPVTHTFVR